ncbi:myoferlin-like, partial [Paramuricea clavata]
MFDANENDNGVNVTDSGSSSADSDALTSVAVGSNGWQKSGSESSKRSEKSKKTTREEESSKAKKKGDDDDWWSKYYAAKRATEEKKDEANIYPKIYAHTLEKEFGHFQDHIKTFSFRRGKMEFLDEEDEDSIVGEFKGALAIYDLPEDFSGELRPQMFKKAQLHRMFSVPCIVRVYIVKAYDLKPKDTNGLSDPYLVVSLGNETFDNKDSYEPDTLEVEFGEVFQFHAVIPDVKDLKVKVIDNDYGNDDLIGETVVDLENRLVTRHHATAGLPPTYNT